MKIFPPIFVEHTDALLFQFKKQPKERVLANIWLSSRPACGFMNARILWLYESSAGSCNVSVQDM